MADGSKIEWLARPGTKPASWNPVSGCSPISEGCKNCYAERMSKRLAGRFGYPADEPFKVTLHEDRLEQPLHWRKPRTVFVCSMGDLFHEDVPWEWIERVYAVMQQAKQHTFIVLTKRPLRMGEFLLNVILPSPRYLNKADVPLIWPHVWHGVTAENQQRADERIPVLLQIPAAVRFVSVEPALEELYLIPYLRMWEGIPSVLDWVICGPETGPGAREMDYDWALKIRWQCQDAGIPFFYKKWNDKETPFSLRFNQWPEA